MRIPGFRRKDRPASADPATGEVYLERRPGESAGAFEMRLAAAARERELNRGFARRAELPTPRRDADEPPRKIAKAPKPPRRRRGGFMNLVGVAVTVVAVLGVLWVVLAVREGSFAGGGKVVDQKIAELSAPARNAANQAVDRTGRAVQDAGQAIENQGEKIKRSAD
jgi:hypothetical protein